MTPPAKKNYTNGDLFKKLDAMDVRLQAIETWKISQDAGKAAVDEYRRQEANENKNKVFGAIKDLLPYITIIIIGAAALVYALAASHGTK